MKLWTTVKCSFLTLWFALEVSFPVSIFLTCTQGPLLALLQDCETHPLYYIHFWGWYWSLNSRAFNCLFGLLTVLIFLCKYLLLTLFPDLFAEHLCEFMNGIFLEHPVDNVEDTDSSSPSSWAISEMSSSLSLLNGGGKSQ